MSYYAPPLSVYWVCMTDTMGRGIRGGWDVASITVDPGNASSFPFSQECHPSIYLLHGQGIRMDEGKGGDLGARRLTYSSFCPSS